MLELIIGIVLGAVLVYIPMALAVRNRELAVRRLIRERNEQKLAEYMSKLEGE